MDKLAERVAKMKIRGPLLLSCFGIFVAGMVAGVIAHDRLTVLLHPGFGMVDLTEYPPERLTQSLFLYAEDNDKPGLLPSGSFLYPHAGYAEGFTRYVLYVNFKGVLPSERNSISRDITVPVWAETE